MKKRKLLWTSCVGTAVACILTGAMVWGALADSVDSTYVNDTFENNSISGWSDLSKDRGQVSVQTEEDGNRYMQIAYNEAGVDPHLYYDMKCTEATVNTVAQADFDIRFSEVNTVKNGHVQLKNRTGSGAAQSKHASRLLKNYDRLRYNAAGTFYDFTKENGDPLKIEAGKWYTVKMIANLEEGWQSIYIRDRDTDVLLAKTERVPTCEEITEVNMVTFMGNTTMDVDNVRMTKIALKDLYVKGNPYPAKGSYTYTAYGLSSSGLPSYNLADVTWSLENETPGVSIDPATGQLTVGADAQTTSIVVQAARPSGETAKYLVDIEL